jgi:phosphoribosylformylglycinamidine synthase
MESVKKFANAGGYVIGICNGFQILTEARLLPGALLRNEGLKFLCHDVYLKVENKNTAFTNKIEQDVIRIPIAHNEGNYFAEPDVIEELEKSGRIVFRYATEDGEVTPEANPNGAMNNIAGIINEQGNVLGMMPHPERYCDPIVGCDEGLAVFQSLLNDFEKRYKTRGDFPPCQSINKGNKYE